MLDLPDFQPLNVVHGVASRSAFDALDHVLILVSPDSPSIRLRELPDRRELERVFTLARKRGAKKITSRLHNARTTGVTIATFEVGAAFAVLSSARELVAECLRDRPRSLGLAAVGLAPDATRTAVRGVVAAASAATLRAAEFQERGGEPHALAVAETLRRSASRRDRRRSGRGDRQQHRALVHRLATEHAVGDRVPAHGRTFDRDVSDSQ